MAAVLWTVLALTVSACGHYSFERATSGSSDAQSGDGNGDAASIPDLEVWIDCDGVFFEPTIGRLFDSSGHNHHAECARDPNPLLDACPMLVPGKIGNACRFDGVDDNAMIAAGDPQLQTIEFTAAVWLLIDGAIPSTNYAAAWIKHAADTSQEIWGIYATDTGGAERLIAGGSPNGNQSFPAMTLERDVWIHIAVTFQGNEFRAYKNGVEAGMATEPSGLMSSTMPLQLGAESPTGYPTSFWPGMLDDARLYTRALTPTEIAVLAGP